MNAETNTTTLVAAAEGLQVQLQARFKAVPDAAQKNNAYLGNACRAAASVVKYLHLQASAEEAASNTKEPPKA